MSKQIDVQQTYQLKANPKASKLDSLIETYQFHRNGESQFFHDVIIPMYAGLDHRIIMESGLLDDCDGDVTDISGHVDTLCATYWFRSMPVTNANKKDIVLQPVVEKLLAQYLGHEPSDAAIQYVRTQNNEGNAWFNCRLDYLAFCRKLKVKDLSLELTAVLREQCLPVGMLVISNENENDNDDEAAADNKKSPKKKCVSTDLCENPISTLFGDGPKEDREVKVKALQFMRNAFDLQRPRTRAELNQIILDSVSAKNIDEFKSRYAINVKGEVNGRPSKLQLSLQISNEPQSPDDWKKFDAKVKEIHSYIKKALKHKSHSTEALSIFRTLLREHLINSLRGYRNGKSYTIDYDMGSWNVMFTNALTSIRSKNISNCNLAIEQVENQAALASNKIGEKYAPLLNDFFKSDFFTPGDDHKSDIFVIEPQHIGRNPEQLLNMVEDDHELAVNDYYDDLKTSLNRPPLKPVLRYILSIRNQFPDSNEDAAKAILAACYYNAAQEKHSKRKVNPTIMGHAEFTFAKGSLNGKLITAIRTDRPDSLDMRIWLDLRLLDEGKWVNHHIPCFSNRFQREIYFPGSNPSNMQIRNAINGFDLSKIQLSPTQRAKIGMAPKNQRIMMKNQMRLQAASEQGLLPSVDYDNNFAIMFNMDKNNPLLKVVYKYKVDPPEALTKNRPIKIGDKIFGWDRNQTGPDTYTILEVVAEDTGITFHDHFVRIVETADITQPLKIQNGSTFDALAYHGLPYLQYADWRKQAKNFVRKWQHGVRYEKTKKNGQVTVKTVPVDFVAEFERRLESYQPDLYKFNEQYAYLLKDIMRGKTQAEIQEIRSEVVRFISLSPASPLIRGSLSYVSFDMIRAAKGLIAAYFSNLLGPQLHGSTSLGPKLDLNELDDELKEKTDPELFALRVKLEIRRQNKGEQKVNVIANAMLSIAIDKGCNFMVGEGQLLLGHRNTKSSQNRRTMDWFSRGVANKLAQLAPRHKKHLVLINPYCTSHQDPFEHLNSNQVKVMRARYSKMKIDDLREWHMKKLASLLKNPKLGTTGVYYHEAAHDFLQHYGIQDLEKSIKNTTKVGGLKFWELQKILIEKLGSKDAEILIPLRGGRTYLATHKIGDDATPINYNGKDFFICLSDNVASTNIALHILRPVKTKKQKNEDQGDAKNPLTPRNKRKPLKK